MKKTLYVSDLDGTLLDRDGWLTDYTINTIRRMSDAGVLVTIATARTLHSCNELIWLMGLRVPVILTNGSTVFDTRQQKYIHANPIALSSLDRTLDVLGQHGLCGFLYALQDGRASIYFQELLQECDRIFWSQRLEEYGGRIHHANDLVEVARHNLPAFLIVSGGRETLVEVQRELEHVPGIISEIYCDIYNDFYFMDIFSAAASKGKALLALQQLTGADEVVAFGDNFNDMQMLLAADRAYVPRNGVAAAQNLATEVLDYCHRDSVAHFLSREFGWE